MRSSRRLVYAFCYFIALLVLSASAVGADSYPIGYTEVFCGKPPSTWRRPEPLVLPPHDGPVTVEISR